MDNRTAWLTFAAMLFASALKEGAIVMGWIEPSFPAAWALAGLAIFVVLWKT